MRDQTSEPQSSGDESWWRCTYGGIAVIGTGAGAIMVFTGVGAAGGKLLIDTSLGVLTHVVSADDKDINWKQVTKE
jgi:hypothetical protein